MCVVDDHRHVVFIVCAGVLFAAGLGAFAGLRVRASPEKEYAEIKEQDADDPRPDNHVAEGDS